jgi:lysine 2,3-aminomutase
MKNTVQGKHNLVKFLEGVLPASLPASNDPKSPLSDIKTRDDFIAEIEKGIKVAPMSIRLTPHILSVIDWEHPFDDPIIHQFVPISAAIMPNHPKLVLDSLHEKSDSPVDGLVHRYPDKALFLATSICNVYCKFCTRSYAVGVDTESVSKASLKPSKRRWEAVFQYIEATPALTDIVISGGDCFILTPEQIHQIGTRLLAIPHIKRIRFATKGLAVCPSRILDPDDSWTAAITAVSNMSKKMGKMVAIHTHFNHPNEMTWISRAAARKLYEAGVMVRNQTVLLRGVNDDVATMTSLIRSLADMTITPYYVYQCDMVAGLEDLRTPLQTILDLEQKIRGSIAGFMTPQFIVDLPGGGGKRLAASYRSYDRETGISSFVAPAVKDGDTVYRYYDPLWSVPKPPADWDAVVEEEGAEDGHAKFVDLRNWTSLV